MKSFSFNHSVEVESIKTCLSDFVTLTRGDEVQAEEICPISGKTLLRKSAGKPVPEGALLVDANGDPQSPASWHAGRMAHRWLQGQIPLREACLAIVGLRARCIDERAIQARAVATALWVGDSYAVIGKA